MRMYVTFVGIQRPNEHRGIHEGTGTSTSTVKRQMAKTETTKPATVTWADVVRKSTVYEAPRVESKGFVSRSFSRNNPVNRTGV